MNTADTTPKTDRKDAFLRYVASLASRITSGETDPSEVNWRYLRDRASCALQESDSSPYAEFP